ncbi:hypothetical protein SmJEL517_g01711 [Synchytrium microbalum]|uniref:Major facilitator superfamily (MFS) profile domain-containing protein n=1 Tax=Synchytrium microbalum TaxID=1806994 RepID=A0A507CDP3_9FUNG|nr:uncharacterized protein SmJEL517_g01711 [Synchytrium microbalum]TPX36034.1 hypothetical protein SmJEL517_g01711 [Synchytrium microbalum]
MSIPLTTLTGPSSSSGIYPASIYASSFDDEELDLGDEELPSYFASSPRYSTSTLKGDTKGDAASLTPRRRSSTAVPSFFTQIDEDLVASVETSRHSSVRSNRIVSDDAANKTGIVKRFFRTRAYVVGVASLAIFCEAASFYTFIPILPFYTAVDQSSTSVSILLTAYSVGNIISAPFLGWLSDKTGSRRAIMMCGLVAAAAAMVCLAFVDASYGVLFFARFLQGFSAGACWTLALAMVSDVFGDGDGKGKAMAVVNVAQNVGQISGPLIGGLLFTQQAWYPSLFCGILIAIDFVAWYFVPETANLNNNAKPNNNASASSIMSTSMLSWKQLLNNRALLSLLVGAFLWSAVAAWDVGFPILLRDRYELDTARIGAILLCADVPGLGAGPLAGFSYDRYGFRPTSLVGLVLMLAAFASMGAAASAPGAWGLALALCFYSVAKNLAFSTIIPALASVVPPSGVGRVYGIFNVVYGIGLSIAPIVAGSIFEKFGWVPEMGFLSALVVVLGTVTLIGVGKSLNKRSYFTNA